MSRSRDSQLAEKASEARTVFKGTLIVHDTAIRLCGIMTREADAGAAVVFQRWLQLSKGTSHQWMMKQYNPVSDVTSHTPTGDKDCFLTCILEINHQYWPCALINMIILINNLLAQSPHFTFVKSINGEFHRNDLAVLFHILTIFLPLISCCLIRTHCNYPKFMCTNK